MQWSSSQWASYDLVYGHFQFGQFDGFRHAEQMCFLREPEARIISWLNHVRRKHDSPYHGVLNSRLGVSKIIEAHRLRELDNGLVRAIGGFGMQEFGELNETHLEAAIGNIERFRFVGFADEMHESIIRLGRILGVRPRRLAKINTNPEGPAESFMTSSDRKELKRFCELDHVLFDVARQIVRGDRIAC